MHNIVKIRKNGTLRNGKNGKYYVIYILYKFLKRNKVLTHSTSRVKPENLMVSERNLLQKTI